MLFFMSFLSFVSDLVATCFPPSNIEKIKEIKDLHKKKEKKGIHLQKEKRDGRCDPREPRLLLSTGISPLLLLAFLFGDLARSSMIAR